mmetsp:Transcript_65916/g.190164  ORF Transcript_65916/g.190164 Transcript_65916/m.190164 type:complete len:306 (+) Transcript_65916:937-1854(+)
MRLSAFKWAGGGVFKASTGSRKFKWAHNRTTRQKEPIAASTMNQIYNCRGVTFPSTTRSGALHKSRSVSNTTVDTIVSKNTLHKFMQLLTCKSFSCNGAQALATITAIDVISSRSNALTILSCTSSTAKIARTSSQKPCVSSSATPTALARTDAMCLSQASTTLWPWFISGYATENTLANCLSHVASVASIIPKAFCMIISFVGAGLPSSAFFICSSSAEMSKVRSSNLCLLLAPSTRTFNFSFRNIDTCSSNKLLATAVSVAAPDSAITGGAACSACPAASPQAWRSGSLVRHASLIVGISRRR